jgi:nuclease S1
MKTSTLVLASVLLLTAGRTDAIAWGCDGHQAIAYIAERLLAPSTLAAATATLTASPVDPGLKRFCDPVTGDLIADGATWADDYRTVDAKTFGWHFINVPRPVTLTAANESTYCPKGDCVVDAIVAQFRALRTSGDALVRANALRFVVHFVGDLHQPLHATTNGDRGGNCVPVTYYDRVPQESPSGNADFSPNLHSVWDSSTIHTLMTRKGLAGGRALADYVVAQHALPAAVSAQTPSKSVVAAWASGSHEIGQTVVYSRLPVPVAIEPASAVTLSSCADNNDVVRRMLAKHETIDAHYEQATVPRIVDQMRLAGMRLAAVLKAAFSDGQ